MTVPLNSLCSCSLETESRAYFFLCRPNDTNIGATLMNEWDGISNSITSRQLTEFE